jgi:hypothetical protein
VPVVPPAVPVPAAPALAELLPDPPAPPAPLAPPPPAPPPDCACAIATANIPLASNPNPYVTFFMIKLLRLISRKTGTTSRGQASLVRRGSLDVAARAHTCRLYDRKQQSECQLGFVPRDATFAREPRQVVAFKWFEKGFQLSTMR